MATITTNKTTSTTVAKAVHAGSQVTSVIYSLAANASAGDLIQLVRVPAGAIVTDVQLTCGLSTANAITANVGDTLNSARYIASVLMSNQGVLRATATGLPYSYSAATTVDLSITAITSVTFLSAWVACSVTYHLDEIPNL